MNEYKQVATAGIEENENNIKDVSELYPAEIKLALKKAGFLVPIKGKKMNVLILLKTESPQNVAALILSNIQQTLNIRDTTNFKDEIIEIITDIKSRRSNKDNV